MNLDNNFLLKLIQLLRQQTLKDEIISNTLNSLMPESTPSVFITPLVGQTIDLISKDNEYLSDLIYQYVSENNYPKMIDLYELIEQEINEKYNS